MPRAYLKPTRERRVEQGHPWVFRSDIDRVEKTANPGDVVDLHAARGKFLGRAYYNPASMITLRMLTREDEPIDRDFFYRRVQRAYDYRKAFCDIDSCRLIYGESDFLPALIVDKFADVCVMQSLALGIDRYKDVLCDAIMDITGCRGIYQRDDVPVRELEGLPLETGFLRGEFDTTVEMRENGIRFLVDVAHGQKTGFFLDQKENRASLAPIVRGKQVLDCFTHTGSFALHAAKFGAEHVTGVDISEDACAIARKNAELNELDNVDFVAENAFDLLRRCYDEKTHYDVIILDPPAFTKTRQAVEGALRGYKEINLRAMKILPPGGFLVTCSCSQHVSEQAFTEMLLNAARDAHRQVRIVEERTQGKDHPILLGAPETRYLKFFVLQVY
ncbi:MAG: class I SAM-dependent rRNA methyltransferase [Candidatus Spyradocola sp.]|nr:class I SAM-dependent rRNA methyltransferase [Candidatus Spyradocola sp.]